MKITWTITKKRGNWRPVLSYACTFEEWEKDLLVNESVSVKTQIPGLDTVFDEACSPGKNERAANWEPKKWTKLQANPNRSGERIGLKLPWRPGAKPDYPEVEEGFRLLRDAYEQALKGAYDSGPFEDTGELGLTQETKQHIAPGVTADRILKTVGRNE